jgi:hypothetical protein
MVLLSVDAAIHGIVHGQDSSLKIGHGQSIATDRRLIAPLPYLSPQESQTNNSAILTCGDGFVSSKRKDMLVGLLPATYLQTSLT